MENGEEKQPAEKVTFTLQEPQGEREPEEEATATHDGSGARPKRTSKPSYKVIQNKILETENCVEDLWKGCLKEITKFQKPEQPDEIRNGIAEARSLFNKYQLEILSMLEFTASASSAELIEDRKHLEETAKTRKAFLDNALKDANDQIKNLLLEMGSAGMRSSATSSVISSVTSARLKAKAKVAAAIKRAELQKQRMEIEARSALLIEQEELALARHKRNEKARLEALRLDEEAAIALATARAIDEELNESDLSVDKESFRSPDLPPVSPKQCVLEYLDTQNEFFPSDNQVVKKESIKLDQPSDPEFKVKLEPFMQAQVTQPEDARPEDSPLSAVRLNPNTPAFIPALVPAHNAVSPYIEFMARRELISNKIEKFDDRPENFHTWKGSFNNMIKGVNLSPSEQLSLMIENTTKESKRLVQRLRNAYIENPEEGIKEAWRKLGERFGSSAVVTQVHLEKLETFPKIGNRENKRLQEFGDLLLELQCAKNDGALKGLKILDEPAYLRPVVTKLPDDLQGRWQRHAFKYKSQRNVDYPPFNEFSKFIQEVSRERNDPYLAVDNSEKSLTSSQPNYPFRTLKPRNARQDIKAAKTEVTGPKHLQKEMPIKNDPSQWCFIHDSPHPLKVCRILKAKPYRERIDLLTKHRVCLRCAASSAHSTKNCTSNTNCAVCHSDKHVTVLHPDNARQETRALESPVQQQGEEQAAATPRGTESLIVTNRCTEICGQNSGRAGRSCAKICLANVYAESKPDKKIKAYALIDEQSNYSLARAKLFEKLNIEGTTTAYTLKTCSGVKETKGRLAQGLVIESLDRSVKYRLPTLTECDEIPNNREEIPTPQVARAHPHLQQIADEIPELDEQAEILLLIGRDVPPLHKVHESRNGSRNAPWGQRLDLGWVVLGNTCLNGAHKPEQISTCKTQVLHNGRPSLFVPCPNRFHVKFDTNTVTPFVNREFDDGLARDVFMRTPQDNKPGTSTEDRRFMEIMENGMTKDENGSWEAPLPFRHEIRELPSSRDYAMKRLKSTCRTLDKKPSMKVQYFDFMQRIFDLGHAEVVPAENLKSDEPCWYLPHFGIYHPKKPDKIRVVFDSAAECNGISLNKLLLPGPDLTNSLLGVLIRFRQDPVAIVADIEQMFHSFKVKKEHRNFLRFLWYKNNDPTAEIIEYRMKVHIFGNTSSPAVANHGLRKTAEVEESKFGSDAKAFVDRNFYVDDGLHSAPNTERATDLLRRTQSMLATANLRLHKIASSHAEVMEAFAPEDHASGLYNLEFSKGPIPIQRSLGVFWDLESDAFTFQVSLEEKPFSRRGVLSVTNSLYDPLGLAAPVIIKGKQLLRSMTSGLNAPHSDMWDAPLPEEYKPAWDDWCYSLRSLEKLKVPRSYSDKPLKTATRVELHTFCDASERAIGAVSYLRTIQHTGEVQVSFVLGKAKLTPAHATTIPRLELCAAVMGVELSEIIVEELERKPDSVTYYSDSKVVLGYVTNDSRRFYVYVSNRVERIRKTSSPHQWHYVPTKQNPADLATRSLEAHDLKESTWHTGPKFLHKTDLATSTQEGNSAAEMLTNDPEVRSDVNTYATQVDKCTNIGSERFSRFSQWSTLQGAITRLITAAQSRSKARAAQEKGPPTRAYEQAKVVILKCVQYEAFTKDIECLKRSEKLPRTSPLAKLCPIIDKDGLLRVGGRLREANVSNEERHPLILPNSCHVSTLIVRHYHAKVQHQGRVFTHGSVRSNGYWIIGGKRMVNSVIDKCLKCKKLRGQRQTQKMADLPADRVSPAPPFSYVGLDIFGPWQICARRTRGGLAHAKRWAVLFTCMATRAIHIEVIEAMDTSSFINALRRFLALRGPVIQLRSDCGSNFIGARNEFEGVLKPSDISATQRYLLKEGCEWIFNPPHASHAGGAWERMIGVTRRILEAMLAEVASKHLTHEVLTTLMAEVSAIVNARPLVPVSSDPEVPEILTPATLLTQKPQQLKLPTGDFNSRDLYSAQWRRVQHLANIFWNRWRKEYLQTLQQRRKWQDTTRNLKQNDLVLLCSKDTPRNDWPLARITSAQADRDGKVRKVDLVTTKDGQRKYFRRPITETILLKADKNERNNNKKL